MRLAVVSPFLDRFHGTERCILEQIERFARDYQWRIHLYSQSVSGVNTQPPPSPSSEDSPGTIVWHKVPKLPGPHVFNFCFWFLMNSWQRYRYRRSRETQPDLVYSPGVNCLDADVIVVHIVFHAFYRRVRPELRLKAVPLHLWPLIIHRRMYYRLLMYLENKLYCDPAIHLIAVSSLLASQLKQYFQRQDVVVIPNAVDSSKFTSEARQLQRSLSRRSFSYSDSDFVLLLIGNDWKTKGLPALLKAVGKLHDLPLQVLVVGADDPGLYASLLSELKLRDTVRFERPDPDVLKFYAAADVYVAPSLEDSFNLPIIEAMSCALPVIASVFAGASELICDGETGYTLKDPQDDILLAHLIRKIYANSSLRVQIGHAATDFVRAHCGWDANVAATRQVLDQVLQQKQKR